MKRVYELTDRIFCTSYGYLNYHEMLETIKTIDSYDIEENNKKQLIKDIKKAFVNFFDNGYKLKH